MKYLTVLLAINLAGCAMVSPRQDYAQLAEQESRQLTNWAVTDAAALKEQGEWDLTSLIAADDLDALVAEALQQNPDLQSTLLTLEIRRDQWRQARGAQLPSMDASIAAVDSEQGEEQYTSALTLNWQPDIWLALNQRARAAEQDVQQQQWLYQAARDTLAAEVIRGWLSQISQSRAINIQRKRLDSLVSNESYILSRYRNGLGSLDDLDAARSKLASAKATMEALILEKNQGGRSLRLLLGRSEHKPFEISAEYPQVKLALARLPEQTLARRPDLKAAYADILASDLRARAAYRDLLPSFSLQAALEDVADSPREALLTDPLWSLLGQLTAPLFRGGQLRAAVDIAELEAAQAYQRYKETLLTALTEVEDTLDQEQSLAQQQAHTEVSLASAKNVLLQYQRSYRDGLVSVLDLLTVQQQTFDLEDQLNTLIFQRLSNRINLGLALGLGIDPAYELEG